MKTKKTPSKKQATKGQKPRRLAPVPGSRSLVPHGGDDRVWTPDALALRIVSHFQPTGTILEPCKGQGSFMRAMPDCEWCEIDEGRDFLAIEGQWDWIVTNPPWSKFRQFLAKAMQCAGDVVFLVTMNHFFTKARMRDVAEAGFGFVEALLVPTPPKPWPQSGFQVAAVHLRKGYHGPMAFSDENVLEQTRRAQD